MSQEIFCTSAPRGLKPGSKGGFCTIAATAGMPGPLAEQLERLSAYRPLYPVGHPNTALNPVSHAHWRVTSGGRTSSVLSRVTFAIDYSQRTSRFAHHIVLDASEQSPAGPAWVMMQPGVMQTEWIGDPQVLPAGRTIPATRPQSGVCTRWANVAGDAGWAGVLAEAAILDLSKPAYILFAPGTDLLPLINEALLLVPDRLRWEVTFNTYFTGLPPGLTCAWRCCASGSDAAKEAARFSTSGLIIDLTKSVTRVATAGPLVDRARTGRTDTSAIAITSADDATDLSLVHAGHPGDRDGLAVSSSTGAPRRRLSGSAIEEYEIEHPLDGTAPAVHPAHVNEGRRGGGRALLWVVSVLWPLVVATLVLVLVRQRGASDRVIMPTTSPDENDRVLADRVRHLESELAATRLSFNKQSDELHEIKSTWLPPNAEARAAEQQPQKPAPTSAPTTAPAQEPKKIAPEQAAPAVADKSMGPPTETAAAAAAATAPHALPLYDELPQVSLPPRQLDGLGNAKTDAIPVQVTVPSGTRRVDIAWAIPPTGIRTWRRDNTVVFIVPPKGMSGEVTIGTLAVTQEPLGLTWRPTHAPAIGTLERHLRSAVLVFQDEAGRDIGRAQFCEAVRIEIALGQPEQRKKAPLHLPSDLTWQLMLMSRPSRWDVQRVPETTNELKFQNGDDVFSVKIVDGAVTTDWLKVKEQLETRVSEAVNEENKTRINLPMREGSIDEKTAKEKGLWQAWQSAQETAKAAKSRRDELSTISCSLGVSLKNGAVLYVVQVRE